MDYFRRVDGFIGEEQVQRRYRQLTRKLIEKKLWITTMESATSGQVASLITDTEGSSAILKGAFITYSNEVKVKMGVPAEIIDRFGVYSEETACAMARTAAESLKADLAVGVTGTMGNIDPANGDSIPGMVYFAIFVKGQVHSFIRQLSPMPDRLSYKLAVAGEIAEVLMEFLEKI